MRQRFDDGFVAPQQGFALVLSILALMLLTFLGLTLATTTSTELQIATNYRWSQQAYYNAEAGIEVAKLVMLNTLTPTFVSQLPPARTWVPPAPAPTLPAPPGGTDQWGVPFRDYEGSLCDTRSGVGYGWVLRGVPLGPDNWQNVTLAFGQRLNGAFTLWVRRELTPGDTGGGSYTEDPDNTRFIVTAEGVAPYEGSSYAGATAAFANANRAVRVLQTTLSRAAGNTSCQDLRSQTGYSSTGYGFAKCANLTGDSLTQEFGAPKTDLGTQ